MAATVARLGREIKAAVVVAVSLSFVAFRVDTAPRSILHMLSCCSVATMNRTATAAVDAVVSSFTLVAVRFIFVELDWVNADTTQKFRTLLFVDTIYCRDSNS